MGTVKVHLVGANLYVPHTNPGSLLAVMPNATRLGRSRDTALDGTSPATHLPVIYEERMSATPLQLAMPETFVGCRLSFDFGVGGTASLTPQLAAKSAQAWFDAPATVLSTPPGDDVSGQVLIERGTVSEYTQPTAVNCGVQWSPADPGLGLDPVVLGLTVEVAGVSLFRATRTPWVPGAAPLEIVTRSVGVNETVEFYVGNLCAPDVLEWPHNSQLVNGLHRVVDDDFKWLLGLSTNAAIQAFLTQHGVLPAPEVKGGDIVDTMTVAQAFSTFVSGGGGAVGCECQGCLDKPRTF